MPVDPNLAPLLELLAAAPAISDGTPQQARDALHNLMVTFRDPSTLREVADISDDEIAGVPVRVYRPAGDGPRPTVVYLHGGGFVIGSIDTHDGVCRQLADDVQAVVVSVDYRLAPEHVFPAAVDDAWAVLQQVVKDVDSYGGAADRVAVGGDSAGGNLAAVCAQLARDAGITLAAQLLVYPATDLLADFPSLTENATGYLLTRADMEWFGAHYLGMDEDTARASDLAHDARLSPALAGSLTGLAPAVVATAEFDPLRDDGNAYAAALEQAGVTVHHRQFAGLIHGFYGLEHLSPAVAEATDWVNGQLRDLLAG